LAKLPSAIRSELCCGSTSLKSYMFLISVLMLKLRPSGRPG
jgi:hypothetical protein